MLTKITRRRNCCQVAHPPRHTHPEYSHLETLWSARRSHGLSERIRPPIIFLAENETDMIEASMLQNI
eukprot:scaffold92634_cov56-Phaeocystis_antarctica.AAC.2